MTDTKFTKGEWTVNWDDFEAEYEVTARDSLSSFNHRICMAEEANAHLIATAPDMYKMIESLTKELELAITSVNVSTMKGVAQQAETQPDLWDMQSLQPWKEKRGLSSTDLWDMQSLHEAQLLLSKARGE